jgi:hypothetical protein
MKNGPAPTKTQGPFGEQLSLIPEPAFSPIWPNPATIAGRVLMLLLRGEWLDHRDVIAGCSSWRLSAYIKDLKNKGWPIVSLDKPEPFENCPSRIIAIYVMPPAIIEQVQSLRGAA